MSTNAEVPVFRVCSKPLKTAEAVPSSSEPKGGELYIYLNESDKENDVELV